MFFKKIPNKLTHQICTSNFLNKLLRPEVFTVSIHVFQVIGFYLIWYKRTLCAFQMAFSHEFGKSKELDNRQQ